MALDKAHNVRVTVDLPTTLYEKVDKFVQDADTDKAKFIRAAIREKMRRDRRRRGARAVQ